MPIRPENKDKYPKNWKEIRAKILKRTKNRCEGSPKYPKCRVKNYEPHPVTKSKVILTIAHLDHQPENCKESNLRAWCQRCHNNYDIDSRRKGIKERAILRHKRENRSLGGTYR